MIISARRSKFPERGNDSGFLDLAGGKKPGFYQRAAYWRDDPVLQIFVLTGEKPELRLARRAGGLQMELAGRTPSSPSAPPPIATKSNCS